MFNIIIFSAVVLNAVLGLVIFFRNRHGIDNFFYALFVIFLDFWIIVNFLENEPGLVGMERLEIFLRLDFLFGVLFMYAWLRFCLALGARGNLTLSLERWISGIVLVCTLIFGFASLFGGLIIRNISFYGNVIHFDGGPIGAFYSIFILACAIVGVVILTLARRSARKEGDVLLAKNISVIIIGFILSIGNAIVINLLQPVLNISLDVSRFGLYGITLLVVCTAYAIIRYQFLNTKVILVETLVICLIMFLALQFWLPNFKYQSTVEGLLLLGSAFAGIFIIRSVHREVRIREESQAVAVRLRELSDMKSQFISFISYQLKSPLSIIKGYISLITGDPKEKLSPKSREMLEKVNKATDDLVGLVDEVLDLRRVDEGRMEYRFEKTDLVQLARQVADEMQPLIGQRKLKVETELPEQPVWIKADPQKFSQILRNLMDNAVKYTTSGFVKISVAAENDKVTVAVSDSGIGISKELLPHLFEEFVRDERVQVKIRGNGIGLYIARKIAEAHGGTIHAESPGEGKGSTFIVSLPAYAETKAAPTPEPAVSPG